MLLREVYLYILQNKTARTFKAELFWSVLRFITLKNKDKTRQISQ